MPDGGVRINRISRESASMRSGACVPLPRLVLLFPGCWIALAVGISAAAQEPNSNEYLIAATQGREVVVLPTAKASGQLQPAEGPISGFSYETRSQRVHVIYFEGRTFRAATPLEGPASRIAFDPSRRSFAPLLPSIRVELDNEAQLESITELVGATKAVFFEKLDFAIIDLPETLHPLQAISRLESVSGLAKATIRVRGPPIQWR